MKALIVNLVMFCTCVLISSPFHLFKVLKYDMVGAYLALVPFIFLLPAVFLLSKQYWKSEITIALWGLRFLGIIGFLITSFGFGISGLDLVTVSGTIGLTFFYEMGYFLSAAGYLKRFLQYLLWASMILLVYLSVIIVPILVESGVSGVYGHIWHIRRTSFVVSWPNYIGMYLVLVFWLVIFVARKSNNRKYYLMLALVLPVLFLTMTRTAFVALGASMLFAAWRERRRFRQAAVLLVVLALLAVGFAGYAGFERKGSLSGGLIPRQAVWQQALTYWGESPVLGYGLRSFTEMAPITKWTVEPQLATAFNDYVDLLVRGGLLYSILFWSFVLFALYRGLKLGNYKGYLFPCLSYSIIALLVCAIPQNPFKNPVLVAFFWIYVAAIAFYATMQKRCR